MGIRIVAAAAALAVLVLAGCVPATPDDGPATLRTMMADESPAPSLGIGSPLSSTDAYTTSTATYVSDGLRITGLLHVPTAPGPHPGVVLVHGGVDTSSYTTGAELPREQDALARAGFVVLVPDLRDLGGSDRSDADALSITVGQIQDVVEAGRALSAARIPALDTSRIGVVGHSLGGMMALAASTVDPELFSAVATMSPVSTWIADALQEFVPGDDPRWPAIGETWGTPDSEPDLWADASAATFADRTTAPILIVYGGDEDDVYAQWEAQTTETWRAAGADVTVNEIAGADHHLDPVWENVFPTDVVPWLLDRI